jgi:biopolymer transport protein ExbD
MAQIAVGGSGGGKKSVDADIPLIPFIDLLLCCVMFLLVSAVWNQLAAVEANQQIPGDTADSVSLEHTERMILAVTPDGYVLGSTLGERTTIPKNGDRYDDEALVAALEHSQQVVRNHDDLIIAPEDGVRFEDMIGAMDLANGAGFTNVSVSGGLTL